MGTSERLHGGASAVNLALKWVMEEAFQGEGTEATKAWSHAG